MTDDTPTERDTMKNERAEETVRLQNLTWEEVDTYLEDQDVPIAIVPIGSTEQHGPHLPLGVDAYQADDLAVGLAKETDALATPPIWYGDADHHLEFPGTISLSTDTVVSVLNDVYDSLVSHGFENIITVNGHRIANLTAIETAAKQATQRHPDALFATIDPLRIGIDIHTELRDGDPEDGMHGGEFETSFMQYLHEELVHEEKFEQETADGFSQYQSNNLVGKDDTVLLPSSRHSPEEGHLGHVGNPRNATPEKGEDLYNALIENGSEFIAELRQYRSDRNQRN